MRRLLGRPRNLAQLPLLPLLSHLATTGPRPPEVRAAARRAAASGIFRSRLVSPESGSCWPRGVVAMAVCCGLVGATWPTVVVTVYCGRTRGRGGLRQRRQPQHPRRAFLPPSMVVCGSTRGSMIFSGRRWCYKGLSAVECQWHLTYLPIALICAGGCRAMGWHGLAPPCATHGSRRQPGRPPLSSLLPLPLPSSLSYLSPMVAKGAPRRRHWSLPASLRVDPSRICGSVLL